MVKEVPLLQYDAEQRIAANEGSFGFLAEMRGIRAEMVKMNDKIRKLESHRQSYLDILQRTISTWVRDALNKDTEYRKKLNKDVIHGGDVRSDAMVVTGRYQKSSTEWQSFPAASILSKNARISLPTEAMGNKREDLIAMLLEERYEEAEKMSSTFLCGNESSVKSSSSPAKKLDMAIQLIDL
ncbi:hypothetical protein N7447_005890 [Penicillium robsamsonii]|uniref:uncharacterized protein n=1 Tax=Penicillium robsamsonii TaxID=1792511 RepID=UPI0025477F4A|nr:uncharacterized protein N7447_005890 [Penicillium robsamsonii]KAJ5823550.1 hypothetical protein N7447_005890 [Penicillium robsamsonii]